ncbi:MAG: hypothetical protein QOD63_2155 [Actinomycetota bacterium]|jgi:hypothetical protein|nr:hypothetical protein [Actinomycetota bacterium]
MEELLLALVAGWAILLGSMIGGFAYCRWRLRRRLRVRPELRSAAPTWWLVPGTSSSRLHLRLRRVASVARTAGAADPSLRPMVADVQDHAVILETHLLVVARCGRRGAARRRDLDGEVGRLEDVTARLAGNARVRPRAVVAGALDPIGDLGERLAALEAARREVARLEQSAGLRPPAPIGFGAGDGRRVRLSARGGLPAR